jgi:hypothetical protein
MQSRLRASCAIRSRFAHLLSNDPPVIRLSPQAERALLKILVVHGRITR